MSRLYTRIEIRDFLKQLVSDAGSQRLAAEKFGFSEQELSAAMKYKRPSKRILDRLRFNSVERYERKVEGQ